MSRIRGLTILTVVASLALAATALAAPVIKITGGTATMTTSAAAAQALQANHLTVTPLAPATASGSTFTFTVAGGHLNKKLHGVLREQGGLAFSNGTTTVRVRHLTIVASGHGVWLYGLVRRHAGRKLAAARIAHITGVTVDTTTLSATGTVRLTPASARVINLLAGKQLATAGLPIGTTSITVTTG
jgi:hypothetical protein